MVDRAYKNQTNMLKLPDFKAVICTLSVLFSVTTIFCFEVMFHLTDVFLNVIQYSFLDLVPSKRKLSPERVCILIIIILFA